ncbi:MAG TPA: hypothetical protein VJ654_01800 [Noviherbaspirillum sp.]|nr:hypothetical protein [Noviherbaspirillum sp.]
MQSTLIIKDLSVTAELDSKAMASVRGGLANQANGTSQMNTQALFAPVSVGNGSFFGGAPANIQVDSYATQYASNHSTSTNNQGAGWEQVIPVGMPGMY